jgi:hypothetical protein
METARDLLLLVGTGRAALEICAQQLEWNLDDDLFSDVVFQIIVPLIPVG